MTREEWMDGGREANHLLLYSNWNQHLVPISTAIHHSKQTHGALRCNFTNYFHLCDSLPSSSSSAVYRLHSPALTLSSDQFPGDLRSHPVQQFKQSPLFARTDRQPHYKLCLFFYLSFCCLSQLKAPKAPPFLSARVRLLRLMMINGMVNCEIIQVVLNETKHQINGACNFFLVQVTITPKSNGRVALKWNSCAIHSELKWVWWHVNNIDFMAP